MQNHELHLELADLITVEEVNKVTRSLLSFVSHLGREGEALQHAAAQPDHWLPFGPSRTTSLVACIPAFTDKSGHSTGESPAQCAVSHRLLSPFVITTLTSLVGKGQQLRVQEED